MYRIFRSGIAWILIFCMLCPMLWVPGSAEEIDPENPEGEFSLDAPMIVNGDWGAPPTEPEPTQPEVTEPETTVPETEPVYQWERPEELGKVPLMLQTDYPDVPYGSGSVATSGCTMACIAMVATYLRGEKITPDALAVRFRKADGSHIQRMEAASTILDLEYTKTLSYLDVVAALKQGKVAIIMLGKQSDFTTTQHLVVCTNILPDGKIMVNDPMGFNYQKPELMDGFTYGFTQGQLFRGFSGGWIYDFYSEPVKGPTNYPGLVLTQEEKDTLAKMIWREARGEPFEGQQAVAEVVLNRVISNKFPTNDVIGTIYAEDQFRTAKFLLDTVADELQYKAIEKALEGPNVLPNDVFYFARTAKTSNVWGQIGGHVFCGLP